MFIYKLIPSDAQPPEPLPAALPLSPLDERSGFIHLSTAAQVPGTLKHFFAADPKVYILRIKYDVVEQNIRWEDPKAEVCGPRLGEGMFPHLYNGKLGSEEVESVATWTQVDGQWDDALEKAQDWLI